jgi:peptidyl-prolyl cis-trans isomerase D
MLAAIREFAKSWPAKGLLLLIALGFVAFGVNQGIVAPRTSTAVIKAGPREVGMTAFRQILDNNLARFSAQAGRNVTMAEAIKQGYPDMLANRILPGEAFLAWIQEAGIKPDKSLIADHMRDMPELRRFFNPVTGVFDKVAFQKVLTDNKIDEQGFMSDQYDELSGKHFQTGVQAGLRAPRLYTALEVEYQLETRDADFVVLDPRTAAPPAAPTDADLQKLYTSLGDKVRSPEMRRLTVVLFDPTVGAGDIKIDPAEVQRRFNDAKDRLSVPEKRSFVQIVTKDAAGAAQVAALLRAGKSPDDAAKAVGAQVLNSKDLAKASIPDTKVAEAVFAMKPGEIQGPIQGDLGFAVVKLAAVAPGHAANLEEARPQIEQALRARAAQDRFTEMLATYNAAHDAGAGLVDAARKAGAVVKEYPAATADGRNAEGARIPPAALEQGFAQPLGDGDLQPLQGGVRLGVRVEQIIPPTMPKLDAVRAELAQLWTQQQVEKELKAEKDALMARLRKGEPLAAVAASEHLEVKHWTHVQRPQQVNSAQTALQAAFFTQPKGQPFASPVGQGAIVLGVVQAVNTPPAAVAARQVANGQSAVSQQLFGDLMTSSQTAARNLIKPSIDAQNLKAAIQ